MKQSTNLHPNAVYQLMVTRANGAVHVTEVYPSHFIAYNYEEGFNGRGQWYKRHSLDLDRRPIDALSLHPRIREACKFALTW